MKQGKALVDLSKNAFKASLILFIVASGLMIYVAIDANPSVNSHELGSGDTIFTYPIYREVGEKFQMYVGIFNQDEENSHYFDNSLHITIYTSKSSDFSDALILSEFTSNGIYREIESAENAYYRLSVSNLSTEKLEIITGDAHANIGLIIAGGVAAIMFGISIALFSFAFSMTLTGLILFGLVYPIYLLVRQDREKQRLRQQHVYYPRGYTPEQSPQNQS